MHSDPLSIQKEPPLEGNHKMAYIFKFFDPDWCRLPWTSWQPFSGPLALPSTPGLYRIRAVGVEELFYVGETGRNLRERVSDLRRNTLQAEMPFNDPHTAAPSLWAWRDAENLEFECSVTSITSIDGREEARRQREGQEFFLLWQYRLEFGSSTRCNHGRFHPRYARSTDRKKGKRGYRLSDNSGDNRSGGISLSPLQPLACSQEKNWMGLQWSTPNQLASITRQGILAILGVYKIFDPETGELLYVGETKNLKTRLAAHARKNWQCQKPLYSFVELPEDTPTYQRREVENDLLGGFYAQSQNMPKFQLINHY